jgi:hypothetical protein
VQEGDIMPTATGPWVVFDYEVQMFRAMSRLLATGDREYSGLPDYLRNAVVESAVLHVRMLADIFLSRTTNSDDIDLALLLPGFVPSQLTQLRTAYGNSKTAGSPCHTINKRLAHPTALRSHTYDYSPVLNLIAPLIEGVVDEINTERRLRGIP